jgi:hypothetical protein
MTCDIFFIDLLGNCLGPGKLTLHNRSVCGFDLDREEDSIDHAHSSCLFVGSRTHVGFFGDSC